MIIDKLIDKLPIKNNFIKLIVGAVITGLLISLLAFAVLKLIGYSVHAAIPSISGVIGAVIYAATRKKKN